MNEQLIFQEKAKYTYTQPQEDEDDKLFHSIMSHNTTLETDVERHDALIHFSPSNKEIRVSTILEAEDHPLLDNETDYTCSLTPTALPPSHQSSSFLLSSSPDNSSPLSSSPPQERTRLKINNSGKLVPVVPPRPRSASSKYSADAISITSVASTGSSVFISNEPSNSTFSSPPPPPLIEVSPVIKKDSETVSTQCSTQSVSDEDNFTLLCLSVCVLLLYLYYSLNPFVYLAGFMTGFMLFYITFGTAFVLYVQYSEREKERRKTYKRREILSPQIDQLPSTIHVDFEGNRELKVKL